VGKHMQSSCVRMMNTEDRVLPLVLDIGANIRRQLLVQSTGFLFDPTCSNPSGKPKRIMKVLDAASEGSHELRCFRKVCSTRRWNEDPTATRMENRWCNQEIVKQRRQELSAVVLGHCGSRARQKFKTPPWRLDCYISERTPDLVANSDTRSHNRYAQLQLSDD
jgi:hypothetical protein